MLFRADSLFALVPAFAITACGDDASSGTGASGIGASGSGASGSGGSPSTGGAGGIGASGGVGGTLDGGGGNVTDGGGGASPDACEGVAVVSFSADVLPLLQESCTFSSCHAGGQPDAGLDLTPANVLAELIDVNSAQCGPSRKRVVAGDPEESYLLDKLLGEDMCGNGVKMPRNPPQGQSAPAWTADKTEIFRAWICGGALDD